MSPDFATVDGHSNVQTFVEEHLVRTGRRCFVVTFNGQAEGLITPNEIKAIQRARWPYTTVGDVMRPLNQVQTVTPNTPVSEALEVMAREDLNQLAVFKEGTLVGVISRANLLQLLRTRAELQV
jgi:CBS domain-containing protein